MLLVAVAQAPVTAVAPGPERVVLGHRRRVIPACRDRHDPRAAKRPRPDPLKLKPVRSVVEAESKYPRNWFDTLVVGISMISLYLPGIPGVSVLRLLRTFRVFRLFKRIPSLKQILICLQQSVPPMCNAFAMCLVTTIYAIVAVTFFGTMRDDLFGDFFSSLWPPPAATTSTPRAPPASAPARRLHLRVRSPAVH